MTLAHLRALAAQGTNRNGNGLVSVCSAHPWVIEATLRHGLTCSGPILIEATCNQVNQFGGYTGMTPADFRSFVEAIASKVGFPRERLILGGDHLGPNPWRGKPAAEAMAHAETMVAAYVAAGFRKLHLDASMGCAGEPEAVGNALAAERAARLAAAAEAAFANSGGEPPAYVIGTEVPAPGGALEALDHVAPTSPEAAVETHRVHAAAFRSKGLDAAFARVAGLVVQPGVEFGDEEIVPFDPARAAGLGAMLDRLPGITFEAHSTDYQTGEALAGLVDGGFRILKVGPWLTFALREALYGLDAIASELGRSARSGGLKKAMESLMIAEPTHWARYYAGDDDALRIKRHYSFSDRVRYYWPHPNAQAAVAELMAGLEGVSIPAPLISQHIGRVASRVETVQGKIKAMDIAFASIFRVLDIYAFAARTRHRASKS